MKPVRIVPSQVLKKTWWLIAVIIVLIMVVGSIKKQKEALNNVWACKEGEWVKVGRPSAAKPPNIPCRVR